MMMNSKHVHSFHTQLDIFVCVLSSVSVLRVRAFVTNFAFISCSASSIVKKLIDGDHLVFLKI